ncbi:MAG: nucleoside hydrolase-like domain-containing protein [Bacteroidota bacterium]
MLTDIEADPDDAQFLVRLLLCANQWDIKGLLATTSCWLKSKPGTFRIDQKDSS